MTDKRDSDKGQVLSWHELLEKAVELGLGAALLTKETAGHLADDLVKRGAMTKDEGKKLVSDLLEKGKGQKEKMEEQLTKLVTRVIERSDLARESAVAELERRVAALEAKMEKLHDD